MSDENELESLRAFVALYRSVYMNPQSHPTFIQESEVMMAARQLTGDDGQNPYPGPSFTYEEWRKVFQAVS